MKSNYIPDLKAVKTIAKNLRLVDMDPDFLNKEVKLQAIYKK